MGYKNRCGIAGVVVGILLAALPLFAKDIVIRPGQSLLIGTMDEPKFLPTRLGVDLAVDQFGNQLLGFPIRTKHLGHGCGPMQNQNIAEGLSKDPKVAGVVGPMCSGRAHGIIHLLSDAQVLTISPANTGAFLTEPDFRPPYYFRTSPNDLFQGPIGADFAGQALGATTAAVIYYEEEYSLGLFEGFNQAFTAGGGTITGEFPIPFEQGDFTAILDEIGEVDVIYAPIFFEDSAPLYTQLRERDPNGEIPLLVSDGSIGPFMFDLIGPNPVEFYASGVVLKGPEFPVFLQDYLASFGQEPEPDSFEAMAYDAATLMLNAMAAVAQTDAKGNLVISPPALLDYLNDPSNYPYLGAGGTYTVPENGDLNKNGWEVFLGQDGEFIPVYP